MLWLAAWCPLCLQRQKPVFLWSSAFLGPTLQLIYRCSLLSGLPKLIWVYHICTWRAPLFHKPKNLCSLLAFHLLLIPIGNFYLDWCVEWRVSQTTLAFSYQKFSQIGDLCLWLYSFFLRECAGLLKLKSQEFISFSLYDVLSFSRSHECRMAWPVLSWGKGTMGKRRYGLVRISISNSLVISG